MFTSSRVDIYDHEVPSIIGEMVSYPSMKMTLSQICMSALMVPNGPRVWDECAASEFYGGIFTSPVGIKLHAQ